MFTNKNILFCFYIITSYYANCEIILQITCATNCENGLSYSEKAIGLEVYCTVTDTNGDKCKNIKYFWDMIPNISNKKQTLLKNETMGQYSKLFIIKENVLLAEAYMIKVTGTTMDGEKYERKTIITVEINTNVSNEPNFFEKQMESLKNLNTTETLIDTKNKSSKLIIKEVIDTLKIYKSMKDHSNYDDIKVQKLLLKALSDARPNITESNKKLEVINEILKLNKEQINTEVLYSALKLAEDTVKIVYNNIDKAKNIKQIESDSYEIFKYTWSVLANKSIFLQHREDIYDNNVIEETDNTTIIENYGSYDDIDIIYQKHKNNIQGALDATFNSIIKLSQIIYLGKKNGVFVKKKSGFCVNIGVYNDLKTKNIENGELGCKLVFIVYLELFAQETQQRFNNLLVTAIVSEKNPYWEEKSENLSATPYITIDMRENNLSNVPYTTIKNQFELRFENVTIKHNIHKVILKTRSIRSNYDFDIHKVYIDPATKLILIKFYEILTDIDFKIVIKSTQPLKKDFQHSISFKYISTSSYYNKNFGSNTIYFPISSNYIEKYWKNFGIVYVAIAGKENKYYSVEFLSPTCRRWDKTVKDWSTKNCELSPKTYYHDDNNVRIFCNCNQEFGTFMSSFQAWDAEKIELLQMKFMLQPINNYTICLITVVILTSFLIFLLVLKRKRRKYCSSKVMYLLDNTCENKYEYLVGIFTGNRINAGTTANIGFQLHGIDHSSDKHLLSGIYEPVLQRDNIDWFLLMTDKSLGELKSISIWTDNYGSNPSWYCDKYVIFDVATYIQYTFLIENWISVRNNNTFITVELSTVHNLKNFKTIKGIKENIKKNHLVLILLQRSGKNEKIISILLCLILLIMTITLLAVNGIPKNKVYNQIGRCHFDFNILDTFVSILIALLTYLCILPLLYFHMKEKLSKKISYIIWSIVLVIISICSVFLLFFGTWIGFYSLLIWCTSVISSLFIVVFILEPIRIILFMFYCYKINFHILDKIYIIYEEIIEQKEFLNKYYELNHFRKHFDKYYIPLTKKEIEAEHEKEMKKSEIEKLIHDLIMFVVYIIILNSVILINEDSMSHYFTVGIKKLFIYGDYTGSQHLKTINSDEELMIYLRDTFKTNIYADVWYGNFSYRNEKGLINDFNTKMLGVPRIRQIRIKNNTCKVPDDTKFVTDNCNSEYRYDIEEKSNFGKSWNKTLNKTGNSREDIIWQYQQDFETKSIKMSGKIATYPAGGYVVQLGRNKLNTEIILDYIENTRWIDKLTRALFIEVNFYNVNQNLFNILSLLIEKSATGNFMVKTTKLLFLKYELAQSVLILLILFILTLFIYFWKRANMVIKYKIKFFRNTWNVVDFIIILTGIVFTVLYFIRNIYVNDLFMQLNKSYNNEYISFMKVALFDDCVIIVSTVLIAISIIRIWRLLEFNRIFRICELTLKYASKNLFFLTLLTIFILISFSITGYVMFSSNSPDFRSFGSCVITLIMLPMGFKENFDYTDLDLVFASIGYIYYFCFSFALLLIINLFIIIILIAYNEAKEYYDNSAIEKTQQEYLKKYIKEKIEYYKSLYKGRIKHINCENKQIETKENNTLYPSELLTSNLYLMSIISAHVLKIAVKRYELNSEVDLCRETKFILYITKCLINEKDFLQNMDHYDRILINERSNIYDIINYINNYALENCGQYENFKNSSNYLTAKLIKINKKIEKLLK